MPGVADSARHRGKEAGPVGKQCAVDDFDAHARRAAVVRKRGELGPGRPSLAPVAGSFEPGRSGDSGHSRSLGMADLDQSDPAFIAFMQWASWIGGGTPRWIIVILLCALVWHWCGPRCAAALGGASLLANLASSLLKLGFGRARPDLIDHLDHQTSFSYPSGHATNAAVVYLMLAWLAPPRWRRAA